MKTYRLSAAGRRTTLVLLVGALVIWAFAIWSFSSTVTIGSADGLQNLPISQLVPALLMLVLIVATPFLFWNLLEEWDAAYTPTTEGLRFESLGARIVYPWEAIAAVRQVDDDGDETIDEVLVRGDFTGQIRNPVVRFLHGQAYGRNKLPIYPGLEERQELINEICLRVGLNQPVGDSAEEAV
jgi:hypothetical protein